MIIILIYLNLYQSGSHAPACHTRFLSTVCTVYASLFIMQPVLAEDQSKHNNINSYALPTISHRQQTQQRFS